MTTYAYHPSERIHIDRILEAYLDAVGMKSLRTKLAYCLHELGANAKKANTKRLYFLEKNLDISDPLQYAEGMRDFKLETVARIDHYLSKLKEAGLYVKFQFRKLPGGVRIAIRNNTELTATERSRIEEKLSIARGFNCLSDAYAKTEDGTEGAGLGIVMMIIMLKNLGFGSDVFDMTSESGQTCATLTLLKSKRAATEPAR